MPTPVSYLSGNTLSYQSGMVKKGTVGLNLTSSLTGNYRWWNGVEVTSSQYLIYSDTYSTGASNESNVTPAAWSTPDLTDTSLLNLINTLPDRVGQIAFLNIKDALIWLNETGKYFLIKNGYENLITSGLTLNLDAAWYNSYSGGTYWYDISGNNKRGTLTNGPVLNTGNTGSIYFDGSDDFCVIPSTSLNGQSSGTISTWVKIYDLDFQYMVSLPDGTGTNGFDILIENGKLDSYLKTSINGDNTGCQFVPKLGIWYNFVTTYDGTTHKIYVNGVLLSSKNRSGTISNNLGQTFVGNFSNTFAAYSNNNTSNVQLYNRALSQTEIFQNYQINKNRFGYEYVNSGIVLNINPQNSISYSGGGIPTYDLSGNGFNGTLTNGTTFDSTTNTFEFDGTDDYIEFPISDLGIPSGSTEFSISVDFNAYIISNYRGIVSFVSAGGPYGGYTISTTSTAGLDFAINLNNAWDSDNTPMSLSANTWYNVTVTFGNGQKKIYKNGTLFTTIAAPGTLRYKAGTERIRFGFNASTNSAKYFIGKIGNVCVYDRMLTETDALQNYYKGNIVTNGLIMNLDAGNLVSYPATGTTWYDLTNTTTGATLVNGPTYNTGNNGSIVLDGTDDYAVGPSNMSISQNQPFTFEFWVNLSSYTNQYPCLLQVKTDTTYGFIVLVTQNNSYDGITFGSTDTWVRLRNAGRPIATNAWNQIVINYNGTGAATSSNYKMYINTQEQVLSTSGGFISLSQINNIGTIENASRGYDNWQGKIANFKQYNRVLTQSEVIQNFNAHKSRYGL